MTKGKPSFTVDEVKGTVKGFSKGGAYVSVPSAWIGKMVLVKVIEESSA